jgi:phosphate-selective porin OprO/OprP
VHWDAGLHIEGKWHFLHVKIGGDVQNDTAGYLSTGSAEERLGTAIDSGVEWRRARVYAEGRVLRHLVFKLRYDFTAGNPPNLKDGHVSFVNLPIPTAGLTLGRFRAPLGLDGYTGVDDLVFMERSLPSEAFLPTRNTGFMLHGDSPNRRTRWSLAVLQPETDSIDLSNSDNLGWSARFANAFSRGEGGKTLVHLGVNFWRRNVSDTIRYATRPESHLAPFFADTGEIAAESANVTVLESAVQTGRVTFESELALVRVLRTGAQSLHFHGFYAQASWFLTGEKRPYRAARGTFTRPYPKRSVRDRGPGAMEVGFRFSRVVLDDHDVRGGTLNDWSVGFNWYPTYRVKVMLNGILADLGGSKPVGILQMRLQVAF